MSSKTKTLVLTLYPLSAQFQALLEEKLGQKPTYRRASELRHGGLVKALSLIVKSNFRRIVVPYEVREAECALSIMKLLAAAHKLPRIETFSPDGDLRRVRLSEILTGAFGLVLATIDGWICRYRLGRRAKQVALRPRERKEIASGPQRILYLKTNLWFGLRAGGSVGHVAGVINGLHESGHEVLFLSAEEPKYLQSGVKTDRIPIFRHYAFPPEENLFRLNTRTVDRALLIAREFKPTMVYQRASTGDWSGVEVARRLNIPLVVEYNGSEVWVSKNWGAKLNFHDEMILAEDSILKGADLVFAISRPLADELLSRGIQPKRVAWYPNCVDPAIFDPETINTSDLKAARAKLGAQDGDYVVTFIGTFGLWHGAEVLAHAITALSRNEEWVVKNRVRFAFIGDGKTKQQCMDLIRQDTVASARTVFTGLIPQNEAPRYLAASDAFVASHVQNADGSKFFGSPTKLFEYMAMERPIVASALEQLAEVLHHEETAVLVPPGDVDGLAEGIRRIVEDRSLGMRISAAAREEVVRRYTWKQHVKVMLDAVRQGAR